MKGPADVFLSLAQLHARGWSATLVRRFLGEPDELRRNPYGGAPLRLYDAARVAEMERTAEVKAAKAETKRRSAAGEVGAATRLRNLYERARAMTVTVRRIDEAELLRLALAAHNAYQAHLARRWKFLQPAMLAPDSAPPELAGALFAYARGQLAEFDRQLEEAAKVAQAELALAIIHNRVRTAILEAYPACDPATYRSAS
ncbi:MAG: hypothetical protein GEU87_01340 [Alphaproteobacteria bacterium]|nr:hypothetical protein [Alphaproteobacteria bacterium]